MTEIPLGTERSRRNIYVLEIGPNSLSTIEQRLKIGSPHVVFVVDESYDSYGQIIANQSSEGATPVQFDVVDYLDSNINPNFPSSFNYILTVGFFGRNSKVNTPQSLDRFFDAVSRKLVKGGKFIIEEHYKNRDKGYRVENYLEAKLRTFNFRIARSRDDNDFIKPAEMRPGSFQITSTKV